LRAVSCTSDTACVAVGGIQPTAGSSVAAIETLSGGQWTLDTTLDAADTAAAEEWSGVSCPAAGACVAVSDAGIAATLSGGTWTAAPMPRGMRAVSCSSVTACTAAGGYTSDRAGDPQPWVAELHGTAWTPFGLPRPVGFGDLVAVSCPADMSCVAGGTSIRYAPSAVLSPPLIESELAA
ncbi:MAG TPA: hypothetical protein VFU35_15290, partial [Jatrophihabitans sp.]|nr:hypothetical protein [Jatrophihabitans sp.]